MKKQKDDRKEISLSEVVDMVRKDPTKKWVEDAMTKNIIAILTSIRNDKPYTLNGPNKDSVTFTPAKNS